MVDLNRAGHFGNRSVIRQHGVVEKDDYPQAKARDDGGPVVLPVSLRDWLAGQALIGVQIAQIHGALTGQGTKFLEERDTATEAYKIADAMLAQRKTEHHQMLAARKR